METGGAGYVHFGEMAANHVQTGQQNAAPFQLGGEGFGDFAVVRAQFLRYAAPACGQIAARFALLRNAA